MNRIFLLERQWKLCPPPLPFERRGKEEDFFMERKIPLPFCLSSPAKKEENPFFSEEEVSVFPPFPEIGFRSSSPSFLLFCLEKKSFPFFSQFPLSLIVDQAIEFPSFFFFGVDSPPPFFPDCSVPLPPIKKTSHPLFFSIRRYRGLFSPSLFSLLRTLWTVL